MTNKTFAIVNFLIMVLFIIKIVTEHSKFNITLDIIAMVLNAIAVACNLYVIYLEGIANRNSNNIVNSENVEVKDNNFRNIN